MSKEEIEKKMLERSVGCMEGWAIEFISIGSATEVASSLLEEKVKEIAELKERLSQYESEPLICYAHGWYSTSRADCPHCKLQVVANVYKRNAFNP